MEGVELRKRILIVAMLLVLLIGATACGKTDTDTQASSNEIFENAKANEKASDIVPEDDIAVDDALTSAQLPAGGAVVFPEGQVPFEINLKDPGNIIVSMYLKLFDPEGNKEVQAILFDEAESPIAICAAFPGGQSAAYCSICMNDGTEIISSTGYSDCIDMDNNVVANSFWFDKDEAVVSTLEKSAKYILITEPDCEYSGMRISAEGIIIADVIEDSEAVSQDEQNSSEVSADVLVNYVGEYTDNSGNSFTVADAGLGYGIHELKLYSADGWPEYADNDGVRFYDTPTISSVKQSEDYVIVETISQYTASVGKFRFLSDGTVEVSYKEGTITTPFNGVFHK